MPYIAPQRDLAIVAAYVRAIARRPEQVTIERLAGAAPSVTVAASATVDAVVRNVSSDSTNEQVEGSVRPGGIPQSRVEIILLAADLEAVGFPLPVEQFDKVTLSSTGARLAVVNVDMHVRALSGAIVLRAAGVE